MYLLLTSQHQRTLVQLVTGFGKSLMFGLMAQYLNQTYNTKVVVVVPNETLAAVQQKKYCPTASKVGDNL
jgi:superfamily II DNA or RNA helicase